MYREGRLVWFKDQPFQALALTGGGYRGLYTAKALQTIEEHHGVPIGRCFDFICGTSIGGIIALAVAFEVKMSEVVRVFEERGELIFPPNRRAPDAPWRMKLDLLLHLKKARYDSGPLREAILELLPEHLTLADAVHPVGVPAINVTQGSPQVFKSRHKADWHRDMKFRVVDVALATSAAPTFFELAEIEGNWYADGGLVANAPDQIAIHEAEHFFDVKCEHIRLLSIGTTTKSYSVSQSGGRNFGVGDWMQDQRLFSVMISGQQQFMNQMATHRLGKNYLRIDHEPSQEQAKDLGLDLASAAAKKTLSALAKKSVTDILGTDIKPFLSHQPQLRVIKPA